MAIGTTALSLPQRVINGIAYKHHDCLADFAGNWKGPGFWVDLWESEDRRQCITLGGNWRFYGVAAPACLQEDAPEFAEFVQACANELDLALAKRLWPVSSAA